MFQLLFISKNDEPVQAYGEQCAIYINFKEEILLLYNHDKLLTEPML